MFGRWYHKKEFRCMDQVEYSQQYQSSRVHFLHTLIAIFMSNPICMHNRIQIRVARRGAEMLAVGGNMVYSTCSLNPIENEAVLHRLLSEANGSLELVDVSDKLPGLKYNQGLSTWTIMNRDLTIFNQPEDVPDAIKGLFRPAIFPPKPEDAAAFHFERWYLNLT